MHPDSYVRLDGTERLKGKDWTKRVRELKKRAGGQCEEIFNGVRCNQKGTDPHHEIPRSRHRDDQLTNLTLLCRRHHILRDRRKVRWSESLGDA